MIGPTWRFVGLGRLAAVVLLAAVLSGAVTLLVWYASGPVSGSVVGVPRGFEPGARVTVEAPVGEPAVFYRKGSVAREDFRDELGERGYCSEAWAGTERPARRYTQPGGSSTRGRDAAVG